MCDGTSRHLVDEPHASVAAATADNQSSSFLPSLLAVYKASSTLRLSDQRDITEGMCSVVSVLDQPRLNNYLQPMLQPIIAALQASLSHPSAHSAASSGGGGGSSKAPAALYDALDRLATLFNHLEPHRNDQPDSVRAAIMQCTQHCWPVMEQITAQFGGDERCMEKVCRCWRYAMKKTGDRQQNNHFKPAVPLMLQAITAQYTRHHTSYATPAHTAFRALLHTHHSIKLHAGRSLVNSSHHSLSPAALLCHCAVLCHVVSQSIPCMCSLRRSTNAAQTSTCRLVITHSTARSHHYCHYTTLDPLIHPHILAPPHPIELTGVLIYPCVLVLSAPAVLYVLFHGSCHPVSPVLSVVGRRCWSVGRSVRCCLVRVCFVSARHRGGLLRAECTGAESACPHSLSTSSSADLQAGVPAVRLSLSADAA